MGFEYVAVPWSVGDVDPQPRMRLELEALGFRLLGGCAVSDRHAQELHDMAQPYGNRAEEFAVWAARPGQVFAAPDGTAFAQLAWLWDCHYGCFTTHVPDGSVIQTLTAWGSDPVWPGLLSRFRWLTTRSTEQMVLATDPEAQVIEGVEAAWTAHQRRLAGIGRPLPQHGDLGRFVQVHAAESEIRLQWARRMEGMAVVLAFMFTVLALAMVGRAIGPQPWWVFLSTSAVGMLLAVYLYLCFKIRARRWRWLKPRFRTPARPAA
ncbi:hypothetical protein [Nocardioides baculatus]|uniref:DUF2812 domain-containing protein n=1 Tax=Nocardioides baculatus TaxID=2801337 RepID=A0ABS1LBW3_9ACTN|nr:hypothetical protein [Nocardioides baculatus]MBL0748026.1 hypothetical protein [Nocardioides baculatus]